MKIETLLPLNRESRDQDLQSVISGHGSGSKRRLGRLNLLAPLITGSKPLQCNGYQRCLSLPSNVLMCRHRSRQTEAATAVWVGVEPVPAGCARRSAGVARVTTGEHWLALGCTGASQAHTGATPYGGTASSQHVYKTSEIFVKNLRFTQYPPDNPDNTA